MVLYISCNKNTVVSILKKATVGFTMSNVTRFNASGVDNGTTTLTPGTVTDSSANSDYYKWLAYWNTTASNPSTYYSQDYLLKTQIVPPVCPSCPTCPSTTSSGICTNCGGSGGSGTLSSTGSSIVNGSNKQYDVTVQGDGEFATSANTDTLGGATTAQTMSVVAGTENLAKTGAGVISGAVDKTGNVLQSTGSGVTNFAGNVVNSTTGLISGAGTGTANLLSNAGSGATSLVRDAGSGATSLARDAGSGITSLFKNSGNNNNQNGQIGSSGQSSQGGNYGTYSSQRGQGSQGVGSYNTGNSPDTYSYYGALPSKGGNFIPVTADFSAFGR